MPGYAVHTIDYHIGNHDLHIRSLSNCQQYADPEGTAARAGVSPASWPLFGVVWPAGLALATTMSTYPIAGKRILELGCGIGLSSLILAQRHANITASDQHPWAEEFLRQNTALNDLTPIHFLQASWAANNPHAACYDLIIGSDLLYERDHAVMLAHCIASHAQTQAEVLIADPGRGYSAAFSRLMIAQGFSRHAQPLLMHNSIGMPDSRGQLFSFRRSALNACTPRLN